MNGREDGMDIARLTGVLQAIVARTLHALHAWASFAAYLGAWPIWKTFGSCPHLWRIGTWEIFRYLLFDRWSAEGRRYRRCRVCREEKYRSCLGV